MRIYTIGIGSRDDSFNDSKKQQMKPVFMCVASFFRVSGKNIDDAYQSRCAVLAISSSGAPPPPYVDNLVAVFAVPSHPENSLNSFQSSVSDQNSMSPPYLEALLLCRTTCGEHTRHGTS